jgi:Zn-dependent protease
MPIFLGLGYRCIIGGPTSEVHLAIDVTVPWTVAHRSPNLPLTSDGELHSRIMADEQAGKADPDGGFHRARRALGPPLVYQSWSAGFTTPRAAMAARRSLTFSPIRLIAATRSIPLGIDSMIATGHWGPMILKR